MNWKQALTLCALTIVCATGCHGKQSLAGAPKSLPPALAGSGGATGAGGGGTVVPGPTPAMPGTPSTPAVRDGSGWLAFGAACSSSVECQSNLCSDFGPKGKHCSAMCVHGACPFHQDPGQTGCTGDGVCKVQ